MPPLSKRVEQETGPNKSKPDQSCHPETIVGMGISSVESPPPPKAKHSLSEANGTTETEPVNEQRQPLTLLTIHEDVRAKILQYVLLFKHNKELSWPLAEVPDDRFKNYCDTILRTQDSKDHIEAMRGNMPLWQLGEEHRMPYEVRFSPTVSVLRTCKKLYAEGLHIFHHENEFVLLKNFGPRGRRLVREGGISPVYNLGPEQFKVLPCMACPPPSSTKALPRLSFDFSIEGRPRRRVAVRNIQIVPFSEFATVIRGVCCEASEANREMPKVKLTIHVTASMDLRPTDMYGLKSDFGCFNFINLYVVPYLAEWLDFQGFSGFDKDQAETKTSKEKVVRDKIEHFKSLTKAHQSLWYAEQMAEVFDTIVIGTIWKNSYSRKSKTALMLFVQQVADLLSMIPEQLDHQNKSQAKMRIYRLLATAIRQIGHVSSKKVVEIAWYDPTWSSGNIDRKRKDIAEARQQLLHAIMGQCLRNFADGDMIWAIQSTIHISYWNFTLRNESYALFFLRWAVELSRKVQKDTKIDNPPLHMLEAWISTANDPKPNKFIFFPGPPLEEKISQWYSLSGYGDMTLEIKSRP